MSDEMKKMMRELEKLLSELNKDEIREAVEKMKLDQKDLEKQLDRTLELFKQLEVEKQIKEAIEKLDRLSKDQKDLAEKTEQDKSNSSELKEEQSKLNKEFEDLKKEIKDAEQKNKELEFPQEMANHDEEMKDIEKDMQQSEEQLGGDKKQQKKASQSQKGASEKMEQLSQKMKQQQEKQEEEQQEEDLQALRILLENLIRFSLDQEALMEDLKTMDVNNPRYMKLAQRQRELKDDARVFGRFPPRAKQKSDTDLQRGEHRNCRYQPSYFKIHWPPAGALCSAGPLRPAICDDLGEQPRADPLRIVRSDATTTATEKTAAGRRCLQETRLGKTIAIGKAHATDAGATE